MREGYRQVNKEEVTGYKGSGFNVQGYPVGLSSQGSINMYFPAKPWINGLEPLNPEP